MNRQLSTPLTVLIIIVALGFIGWIAYKNIGAASGGGVDQASIDKSVGEIKAADTGTPPVTKEEFDKMGLAAGMGGGASSGGGGKKLPGPGR